MPLLTKQDLIDSPTIRLGVNTDDRQIDPHIIATFEFEAFNALPYLLADAVLKLHLKTGQYTAADSALEAYFDANMKSYYMLQAFLNYIEAGSEAILTASGFRTFKELQSDPASKEVYAQILNKYEKYRDAARNRMVQKLIHDNYTIDGIAYNGTTIVQLPIRRKQRHFNIILPDNPID